MSIPRKFPKRFLTDLSSWFVWAWPGVQVELKTTEILRLSHLIYIIYLISTYLSLSRISTLMLHLETRPLYASIFDRPAVYLWNWWTIYQSNIHTLLKHYCVSFMQAKITHLNVWYSKLDFSGENSTLFKKEKPIKVTVCWSRRENSPWWAVTWLG